MRKFILLTLLGVFTTLAYGQCPNPPAAPSVDANQYYCSAAAWMLIGEGVDYLSDLQIFPDQVGWSITWYEDNAGAPGNVIANPSTELLVAGTSYHVTQSSAAGCESAPTMITVNERDCACIKDPTFEDQQGNPKNRGYTYTSVGIADGKTCGQGPMDASPPITVGATNSMATGNKAVFVTPGADPTANVNLVRTTPNNPSSSHGFRLGRNSSSPATVTSMQKHFIAGEVFVFDFAMVLQNPKSPVHEYEEMPFAQVNLYDQYNNLISTRCIVSDVNDCVFNTPTDTFYTNWSCMKLNTFEYQGEPLRAEFYVSDCQLGGHYGYIYIDDIYVGDDSEQICGDAAFGYALLNSITADAGECFITLENQSSLCGQNVTASVAGFPLQVCGKYDAPISQGTPPTLDQITLNLIQNDIIVGSVINPSPGSGPGTFCFTVQDTDINVLPYGDFKFEIEVEFEMDCGSPYSFYLDDKSSVTVLPRAGCPAPLRVCDIAGTGISIFDLTQIQPDLYNNMWDASDMTLTYFEDEQDAHDGLNAIPDPTKYQNTVPGSQTVYVRIEWNVPGLPPDSYYLAEIKLEINVLPDLSNLKDTYIVCDPNFEVTISGVPDNLADLGDVTYKWFRNGVQLASSSSFYNAKTPGTYTVIVANYGCESSHDFEIELIEFDLDLGPDPEVSCDGSDITLNAAIIPGPNTPPIDVNDVDFLWSTGETTQSITVSQSGTYTVEVSYEDCVKTMSKTVKIGDLQVDLGEDIVLCDTNQGTILNANVTGVPENEVTYLWSNGQNTPSITVYDLGTYTVDVSWNGCVATDSITLIQETPPNVTLGNDFQMCDGDDVTLQVIEVDPISGGVTYSWTRDGSPINGDGPSITVNQFGTYTVFVNNEGCIGEASVTISPYSSNPGCTITQGISPDGSPGLNDNLDLTFLSVRTGITNLQIFNRLGSKVYEMSNYIDQWEGQTTDGDKLPTGAYYYVINLAGNDPVYGNQTSGWIYINRGYN